MKDCKSIWKKSFKFQKQSLTSSVSKQFHLPSAKKQSPLTLSPEDKTRRTSQRWVRNSKADISHFLLLQASQMLHTGILFLGILLKCSFWLSRSGVEGGLGLCISNKLPGDVSGADAAGPWTTLYIIARSHWPQTTFPLLVNNGSLEWFSLLEYSLSQ